MKRRDFIAAAAAATAWPITARAQAPDKPRTIGVLMVIAENDPEGQERIRAFREGLAAAGWIDGQTAKIVYRWADGQSALVSRYAEELVALKPDVILANGTPAVVALKRLGTTIPVVCALVLDPVGVGVVQSLSHPGGNITGFSFINAEIIGKWREILAEAAPSATRSALIFNPNVNPWYYDFLRSLEAAPQPVGKVNATPVTSLEQIRSVIAAEAGLPGGSLIIGPDAFAVTYIKDIADLALEQKLPGISVYRQFVASGGLMSYGPDLPDIFRRAAGYVDRILKGANPADLPVQDPTKFNFAINLKTAKALGLAMPQSLLATADEVIE
jgi:putative ABC transport system substrate-binding protein